MRRRRKLAIVGAPNVGKSVLFNALTGAYATVSNYPGTTVEVLRGLSGIHGVQFEIIDTPGAYSLTPITEEERVTLLLLLGEDIDIVVHVVDARNLRRMLPLTLQLIEAGFLLIVDVNILDEAERIGMKIDIPGLERELGVAVVGTVLTRGLGIDALKDRVVSCVQGISEASDEAFDISGPSHFSGMSRVLGDAAATGAAGEAGSVGAVSAVRAVSVGAAGGARSAAGAVSAAGALAGALRGVHRTCRARHGGRAQRALSLVEKGDRPSAPLG